MMVVAVFVMMMVILFSTRINITFQTKHPNDVMEEWKKLYKMVNSLFEEVILQTKKIPHRSLQRYQRPIAGI